MDVVEGRTMRGPRRTEWTPARIFMLVSAVYHLPLGIAGLLIDRSFPVGTDEATHAGSDHVFGIFETNGWHSAAALALGVLSIYLVLRPRLAREGALAIGIAHVGIVIAFAVWPPETFWFASNAADQVVHTFTAIAGLTSGLLTPRRADQAA